MQFQLPSQVLRQQTLWHIQQSRCTLETAGSFLREIRQDIFQLCPLQQLQPRYLPAPLPLEPVYHRWKFHHQWQYSEQWTARDIIYRLERYHVLGVLRQEFSPTLRDKLPTDFAVLDTLRVHLDLTANLLLGQYLPRALARTLQEQWGMETLRTEITPEVVLELAIQCIALPYFPEPASLCVRFRTSSSTLLYSVPCWP